MLIRPRPDGFQAGSAVRHDVDERWLMAYAAGVRDTSSALFDLDRPGGIVAHPVFPVCVEWPLMRDGAVGLEFDDGDPAEGLHSGHEIRWHRPIRAGDRLFTRGRLRSVEQKKSGVLAVVELTTEDSAGEPVVETRETVFYLGAELDGDTTAAGKPSPPPSPEIAMEEIGAFQVSLLDAVVYGECARIYNPVHTDIRRARAAGLSEGPLLHGTATFARCVSLVVERMLGGDAESVARIGCRMAAPVPMPSRLTVSAGRSGEVVRFHARTGSGEDAITHGLLEPKA
ncbi:MAG: MaoC family dehydratase N-terminal domain-containing protein [Solirubrobacterales bacterium]